MKVAFIGTSCSGKTTMLERCRSFYGEASIYLEEVAREYFRANVVENRMSPQVQGTLMHLILERERALSANTDCHLLFCDRSVVDAPIYVSASGDPIAAEALLDEIEGWIGTYSKLFLTDPTDIPYRTDDIRTESADIRAEIHDNYLSFLTYNAIPFELLSGSVDERMARVAEVVKGLVATKSAVDHRS